MTTSILLASCGGAGTSAASAPPIDLPAPITGRIDISEPDADGNVTITGTDGAVTAGSTVIAVNETVAGQQSLRFLDALIPSAYAQSQFPAVCSETGRACALADANGAFVIVLPASRGDSIAIGLIDPTSGDYISELVRTTVPTGSQGGTTSTTCAGLGLSGAAVDLVIVPGDGTTIALHQGSDTATNRVVIRNASTTNTVSIGGCYATALDVTRDSANAVYLAATSSSDMILWTGNYENGNIWNGASVTLSGTPSLVEYVGVKTEPIVAVGSSGSVVLQRVTPSDGSVTSMGFGALTMASITDIDLIEMTNGRHLGALVARDTTGATWLVFFHADTLTVIDNVLAGSDLFVPGDGIVWASFFVTTIGATEFVSLAVVDNSPSGGSVLHLGFPISNLTNMQLERSANIDAAGFALNQMSPVSFTTDVSLSPNTPVDIAIAANAAPLGSNAFNSAILPMSDGTLVAVSSLTADAPDATIVGSFGFPLSAIAVSNADQAVDVLDATSGEPALASDLFTWSSGGAIGM